MQDCSLVSQMRAGAANGGGRAHTEALSEEGVLQKKERSRLRRAQTRLTPPRFLTAARRSRRRGRSGRETRRPLVKRRAFGGAMIGRSRPSSAPSPLLAASSAPWRRGCFPAGQSRHTHRHFHISRVDTLIMPASCSIPPHERPYSRPWDPPNITPVHHQSQPHERVSNAEVTQS